MSDIAENNNEINTDKLTAFDDKNFFKNGLGDRLATIRIKKVVLDNFKSVEHGEIVFNCGKQFIPYGTSSDILGIYGQNGSGKTSLIEALYILKGLMMGYSVPYVYADCISVDKKCANLLFVFDMQYQNGMIRELEYLFSMDKIKLTEEQIQDRYKDAPESIKRPLEEYRVRIFNEKIRLATKFENGKSIMQTIIDTSADDVPFSPATKLTQFIGNEKKRNIDLEISKKMASEKSRSFVFSVETFKIFYGSGLYSEFFEVLVELRFFAKYYFFVVDTKSSGFIRLNFCLPIYTRSGLFEFDVRQPETLPDNGFYDMIMQCTKGISDVLGQLVPGLSITFKTLSETVMENNTPGKVVMLMANRNGIELPLRDESDGVRKIISILSLIIAVYNDRSLTLAIDEFDAGIFEYLLGELLQTIEESGKGQFIFTSHNLRPLEVINKKFLIFTTTNPKNRYFRLKSIGKTNNLRDSYFREIVLGEQEEELYNKTKRYKIAAALKKACDKEENA